MLPSSKIKRPTSVHNLMAKSTARHIRQRNQITQHHRAHTLDAGQQRHPAHSRAAYQWLWSLAERLQRTMKKGREQGDKRRGVQQQHPESARQQNHVCALLLLLHP